MSNPKNREIDQIFQFILLTAGQEDDFRDRQLGAIHLIKYLYLADLAYAEEHNGETYTGITWKFHHFGPWSNEAYARIEPALREIEATSKKIPSNFTEDMLRWTITDDELYQHLAKELPDVLTRSIRKHVHQFNGTTEDLLHFVYNTLPMLRGTPGETLDFSVQGYHMNRNEYHPKNNDTTNVELSFKQKKKRKQVLEDLKKHFQERLETKMNKPKIKPHPPRYDEIYYEGLKTFDSLAGENIATTKGVIQFSDDIWKSKARFDPDVS